MTLRNRYIIKNLYHDDDTIWKRIHKDDMFYICDGIIIKRYTILHNSNDVYCSTYYAKSEPYLYDKDIGHNESYFQGSYIFDREDSIFGLCYGFISDLFNGEVWIKVDDYKKNILTKELFVI